MIYTRRKLLRDATMASVAAAACSGFAGLTACNGHPRVFQSGIRVFFIGSWLFCEDTSGPGLLAIALDMPDHKHRFPFGVWPGDRGINQYPSLASNKCDPKESRNAYSVQVCGFKTPHRTTQDVFNEASDKYWFNYLENKNALSPSCSTEGIRVISIPIPTRILSGNFLAKAQLNSADSGNNAWHKGNQSTPKGGSAHIFEYVRGNALSFEGRTMICTASQDYRADFHFHTVPLDDSPHGPEMVSYLWDNVVKKGLVTASIPNPEDQPTQEWYLPNSVNYHEMDIPDPRTPRLRTTASCAGLGGGLGGNG